MMSTNQEMIVFACRSLELNVLKEIDDMYERNPEGFEDRPQYAALLALSYDLPRVVNAIKNV